MNKKSKELYGDINQEVIKRLEGDPFNAVNFYLKAINAIFLGSILNLDEKHKKEMFDLGLEVYKKSVDEYIDTGIKAIAGQLEL